MMHDHGPDRSNVMEGRDSNPYNSKNTNKCKKGEITAAHCQSIGIGYFVNLGRRSMEVIVFR